MAQTVKVGGVVVRHPTGGAPPIGGGGPFSVEYSAEFDRVTAVAGKQFPVAVSLRL